MSLYRQYKSNPDAEKNGVVLTFGPNSKGNEIRIRVARNGGTNDRYLKAIERHLKPHRRAIQTETMDREVLSSKMLQAFADGCVLDWENVEDENCNDMPFTRENVVKLLTDLPDLYADVQEQSGKVSLFKQSLVETDTGN